MRPVLKLAAALLAAGAIGWAACPAWTEEAPAQEPRKPRTSRITHADRMKAAAVLKRMKAEADARRAEHDKRNQAESQAAPVAAPLAPSQSARQ
jgi:hypothetical protein